MRDAIMTITFILSATFLYPNLYLNADLGLPITAPIATLVLFWALAVKVTRDSDDNPGSFKVVSILLLIASALYIVPQIYGVESGDQVDSWNAIAGLGGIPGALVSGTNLDISYPILNLSLLGFAVTGGVMLLWFMRRSKFEPAEIA